MQCSNCHFENMPGVDACGRCGASLRLAAADIDVHPPRASRRAKVWRRAIPRQGFWAYRWNLFLTRVTDLYGAPKLPRSEPAAMVRMLVPGWAQIYIGSVQRGRLFLILYVVFLLLGLVHLGTFLGSVLLGLALSVHLSSIVDVIFSGTHAWPSRIAWTLTCWVAVGLIVYFPAIWAASWVVVPQQIAADVPPFRTGDVILYNPSAYSWSEPEIGDVVVYRIPPGRFDGRTEQGYPMVYDIQGLRIDRILAGPGQTVHWSGQQLRVDEAISEWLPLNMARIPTQFSAEVPRGCYLILPSTDPVLPLGGAPGMWRSVSLVPVGNLLGRVYLRHQPLYRFWWVR
jgi:hypothetical protein